MIVQSTHSRRPKPGSKTYLESRMKQWLWAAGYRRCIGCGEWRSDVDAGNHCKPCAREHSASMRERRRGGMATQGGGRIIGELASSSSKADAYFASQIVPEYYRSKEHRQHLEALGGLR